MKILQINKFFYTKGGTETYLLSLISLLSKNGHEIIGFSQKNKNNINIKGQDFFIEEINLDKFYFKNILTIGRIFWSFAAKNKIRDLISKEKIDLVHIHNIYHQISPSILPEIKKAGLPIIMTVHDFKLVSPSYTLFADKNQSISKPFIAKLLMSLEYYFHKSINVYKKNVDVFIAPSEFVKNKLIDHGFEANKIIVLPHFIEKNKNELENQEKNYIVCFGRLDESKGVDTLIKALAQIKNETFLKIIGSGPYENELKKLASDLKIEHRIEFIPHIKKSDLELIISQSMFAVFPSLVHETFGLGIIESYLLGKPVIASKVGALTENVIDHKTGLLVEPKNVEQLKMSLEKMISNPDLRKSMGLAALEYSKEKFTPELHLQKLNKIYETAVARSKAEKNHFELEKKYALEILAAPIGPIRNEIIAKAYDDINTLVNNYRPDGIRGHSRSTFNLVKNLVSKNDLILDYGCGGGELVGLLSRNGYQAFGFDVSSAMTKEASQKQNLENNFISGDITKIENKYDLIIMDNVIEHIAPDEITETLNKLKNILKDHGQLLIITPHRFSGPHDISGHFLKLGSKAEGLHLKEFDLKELASDAKKSNYSEIFGYFINPRITEKIGINIKPRKLWLKKSLLLEKIAGFKIFSIVLRLNRKITKIIIALMFPNIIIAKK